MTVSTKMIVMVSSSSSSEMALDRFRRRRERVLPESEFEGASIDLYQSEYFVPSVAVPVD